MGIGKSFVLCKKCERSAWFSTTRKEGRSGGKDGGGAERTEWREGGRESGREEKEKGKTKMQTQELSKITLDLHNCEKTAAPKGFYISAKMSDCWRV